VINWFRNNKKVLLRFVGFGILVFLVHWSVVFFILNLSSPSGFWAYHVFLFVLTLINLIIVIWLLNRDVKLMGMGFMAAGFFKMLLSVIFLLPVLLHKKEIATGYALQFLVIYVIYLVYEVVYIVRLLKK